MKCPNCKVELIKRECDPEDIRKCPLCPFITSKNKNKAEYMYAVLAVDEQGNEGLMASSHNSRLGPVALAMVATRKELLEPLITDEFRIQMKEADVELKISKYKRVDP